MPSFTKSNTIGLAGEYLVGAIVARQLRWPYRMQPIADLGIDGEIEVLDGSGQSTGRIIKVQCKSDETIDATIRHVDLEHFEYWNDLAVPVIVVHPRLTDMTVLWSPLSNGRMTNSRVAFDLKDAKILNEESRNDLDKIAVKKHEQFDPFLGLLKRLHDDTGHLDYTPMESLDEYENLIRFDQMRARWALADALAKQVPEMLRPRSRNELENLKRIVEHIEEKMNAVVGRRPMR